MTPGKKKQRLQLHQIIFFSMGQVMNDLMLAIFSSYLLLFQIKVLGLPSNIVGLLWLVPTGIDAFLALLIGYVSDNITIPYFSKCYGKRKSWHLIGCVQVGLFTPFLLMRCFACGGKTGSWQVVLYYVAFQLVSYSGWGLTQSNYLALIPEIATRRSEMVKLGAVSSAVTLICGIYVYVVTWVLLGQSTASLSSKQTKEFMLLAVIVALTGAFFVILFHTGTRENSAKQEPKKKKSPVSEADVSNGDCSTEELEEDSLAKQETNQRGSLQATSTACNSPYAKVSVNAQHAIVNPSYAAEEEEEEEEGGVHDDITASKANSGFTMKDSNKDVNMNRADTDMKTVALKNFLMETLPKENIEKPRDDNKGEADSENFESKSYEDTTSGVEDLSSHESTDSESVSELFMPETFMDMVPYHSKVILSSCRCSKVSEIDYLSGQHSRFESKIYQRSPSQGRRRFSRDESEGIPSRYSSRQNYSYRHGGSSLPSRTSSRSVSRVYQRSPSQARRSAENDNDDNLASGSSLIIDHSHDSPSIPSRHSSRSASKTYQKASISNEGETVDKDEHFPRRILSSRQNSRISRGSPRTRHSRIPSKNYQTSRPLAADELGREETEYYVENYTVKPRQGFRFSITSEYFYDTPGVENIQYQLKDRTKPWEKLFKNPVFYKLGGAYMFTRLAQNVTNSYMPLYLTDHLKFDKIAIAYFPLVILISGVFASFAGKKLNRVLGNKWAFCLGSILVMVSSSWFYLLNESTRLVMYIPTIMSGTGTSIMFVTTLALAAEFVDADRGSGAFLMASMSFIGKIVGGTIFCLLQEYSPKGLSSGCPECTEYVRYVFSFTPGVSALLGLVTFILFIPATIQCRPITTMEDAATQTDDEEHVDGMPAINSLNIINEDEKEDDAPQPICEVTEVQHIKENQLDKKETQDDGELNTVL